MKKFKFSMQKVLEFTEHMEDKEKAVLKEMQFVHKKMCDDLENLKNQYQKLKSEFEIKCEKGISISEMIAIRTYISELVIKIDLASLRIKRYEKEIDTQIAKLIAVSREKTIMEKLKDKKYSNYKIKKRKGEELFIDDFVANLKYLKTASSS